jgi:hypothetical protein
MQTLAESMNMLMPQAAQKSLPAVGGPQRPPRETNVPAAALRPQMMDSAAGAAPQQPFGPSPFGQGPQQFSSVPKPVGYGYDGALEQPRKQNQLMQALARMG